MPTFAKSAQTRFAAMLTKHGRTTVILLAIIMALGFGLRMDKVINPLSDPGDDAFAYRALAESLYEEGTYGGSDFNTPSDWSPGAPLLYAGTYYLTGGVRDGVGRGAQALLGTAAILIAYLLTLRLSARRSTALLAAGMVALYPPFIYSTGALMSEPPALFTLPAAVLALLWADSNGSRWAWLLPGLLFGITALIRPEYLFVAFAFVVFVLVRRWMKNGAGAAIVAASLFLLAVLVPVVPWTVHNYVQLDRIVPISTGSGKALYVGTYLPADGEYQRVKADLYERYTGVKLLAGSDALDEIDPVPLFDRVAATYPGLSRDAALGRAGKENLNRFASEDPFGYAGMTLRKVWRMWSSGVGELMSSPAGRVTQLILVLAGMAGLGLLVWRRRWEAIAIGLPVLTISAIGAATLAPPRRNEILMTLVLPLAALTFAEVATLFSGNSAAQRRSSAPVQTTEPR
ncbi:MAG: phospholipid carrier-dependent glycosyltransferase [Solirubrobacterales bacterium]